MVTIFSKLQDRKKPVMLEDVKLTDLNEYNRCLKVLQMSLEEFNEAGLWLSVYRD